MASHERVQLLGATLVRTSQALRPTLRSDAGMALERAAPDSRCKSLSHFRPEQFEEPKTLKLSVMGYVGVGAEALFRGRVHGRSVLTVLTQKG
jgi:hypothetical protein